MIVLYNQTKTPIGFSIDGGRTLKFLIWWQATLPVELTKTHDIDYRLYTNTIYNDFSHQTGSTLPLEQSIYCKSKSIAIVAYN